MSRVGKAGPPGGGLRSVLFVGIDEHGAAAFRLPEDVAVTFAQNSDEALASLATTTPALVVVNELVGEEESLDFFGRVVQAMPDSAVPVVFLTSPHSGVEPFWYQRRRAGFQVRYVDASGEVHDFFVDEPTTEKAFTIRALPSETAATEVRRFLSGGLEAPTLAEGDGELWEERLFEIGFNQDVEVGARRFHVQTEVTSTRPPTATVTVFEGGRAASIVERRLTGTDPSPATVSRRVEELHAEAVFKVGRGMIG